MSVSEAGQLATTTWLSAEGDAVGAAVGAGAEEEAAVAGLPAPTVAVYEARAHAWALGVVPPDATHWA